MRPLDCFAALAMTVELTQQLLGIASASKTPKRERAGTGFCFPFPTRLRDYTLY
jgi:hypothetical protein